MYAETTENVPERNRNSVEDADGIVTGIEENLYLASLLTETARLLATQDANPFRVAAYRRAADLLISLEEPIRNVHARGGREALAALPHIGVSLARTIETWLATGTVGILSRLRGEDTAERVLGSVPGIGPELARRIHHRLHIASLDELYHAAQDGRLGEVEGIGLRRLQSVRDQLETRLQRGREKFPDRDARVLASGAFPPVSELLEIDEDYRQLAARDRLPKITPRRFNRSREAWLPILHTHRGDHHYSVHYSNTARAHELGRTRDWVVIYLDQGNQEGQWTIVTERCGPLVGRRVVRGREAECAVYFDQRSRAPR